jgi:hypothetical protein
MQKNSVLFFTQNQWAFGQIHHALIKRFYTHGVYAHLLNFYQEYRQKEYDMLNSTFKTFVTTPEAVARLMHHGIPPNKIVAIAHAERDVVGGVKNSGTEVFNLLKGFGVINKTLSTIWKSFGVAREPTVVRNGVDFDYYYAPASDALKIVGYAGAAMHPMSDGSDCKRSYLASRVMENSGLEYRCAPNINHLCMAAYYRTIDAVLVTSNYEACGLPILEAAAAGRLVVSPEVGYFDGAHGALCRLDDEDFVADAKEALAKYQDPALYKEACEKAQQYARDHYDWGSVISGWLKLICDI